MSTNPGLDRGGIGPGDSGGPAFIDGSTTVAAVGSHVTNPSGSGNAYATRLDRIDALAFISPFLS